LTADTHSRPLLFQPVVVFVISLTAAICFGLYLLRGALVGSNSFQFPPSFFYVVPIIVPFVAFLLDRLERFPRMMIRWQATEFGGRMHFEHFPHIGQFQREFPGKARTFRQIALDNRLASRGVLPVPF